MASRPITMINISDIRIDAGVQPRVQMNALTIVDYAEAMDNGADMPAITVFKDPDGVVWLADGFHRVEAAKQCGHTMILADVRTGGRRDAILYSVGSNATHGLPRTNSDKRRAVETVLRDPEWFLWSDREIARRCQVSDRFVNQVRADWVSANGSQIATQKIVQRDGRTYVMDTAAIGKGIDESPLGHQVAFDDLTAEPEEPMSEPEFNDDLPDDEPEVIATAPAQQPVSPAPASPWAPKFQPQAQPAPAAVAPTPRLAVAAASLPQAEPEDELGEDEEVAAPAARPAPVMRPVEVAAPAPAPMPQPAVQPIPAPAPVMVLRPVASTSTMMTPETAGTAVILTVRIMPGQAGRPLGERRIMLSLGEEGKAPAALKAGMYSDIIDLFVATLEEKFGKGY
jgi:hypothetical protein